MKGFVAFGSLTNLLVNMYSRTLSSGSSKGVKSRLLLQSLCFGSPWFFSFCGGLDWSGSSRFLLNFPFWPLDCSKLLLWLPRLPLLLSLLVLELPALLSLCLLIGKVTGASSLVGAFPKLASACSDNISTIILLNNRYIAGSISFLLSWTPSLANLWESISHFLPCDWGARVVWSLILVWTTR